MSWEAVALLALVVAASMWFSCGKGCKPKE
jgi:hypothetical protein